MRIRVDEDVLQGAPIVSDRDDQYRFYPEDFEDGNDPTRREIAAAPLVIVACLGVGVVLFLADPFVDPITVSGTDFEFTVLAAIVFAVGLFIGSSVYVRQGRRRLGFVHAVGSLGWLLLVIGTAFSSTVALAAGGGALVFGAAALVLMTWRSSA
ncbi:MAG: hypothetical protein ACQET5_13490 [Halobacteriota archaeon]|uniref:hypothetical protein n=1 Tax=Natronomonas sp. TaxID=2184060 RepID=UPI0039756C0D